MKLFSLLCLLSLVPVISLAGPALKVGDVVGVPKSLWLELISEARNGNNRFEAGEDCVVHKYGTLVLTEIQGDDASVTYRTKELTGGTMCPSGALLIIKLSELQDLKEASERVVASDRADKELISKVHDGKIKAGRVGELEVGQAHVVPKWTWINLASPGEPEESCGIKAGGRLEILAFSSDEVRAYVKYTIAGDTAGTPCESGVRFFIGVGQLADFTTRYQELVRAKNEELALIAKLLKSDAVAVGKLKTGSEKTISKWAWVTIKNLEPVAQEFRNLNSKLSYGDTCGVEENGRITVVGFDEQNKRVLVRYQSPGRPLGTPCPTGVLFFISQTAMENLKF